MKLPAGLGLQLTNSLKETNTTALLWILQIYLEQIAAQHLLVVAPVIIIARDLTNQPSILFYVEGRNKLKFWGFFELVYSCLKDSMRVLRLFGKKIYL